MKIISDFDDVIFNTKGLKEVIFSTLSHVGVSRRVSEERYQEFREAKKPFSLKEYLMEFAPDETLLAELY